MTDTNLAQKFIDQLSLVMPPDFKDWHDNADSEKPKVAAFVIRNLRERLESELNESDRLRREVTFLRRNRIWQYGDPADRIECFADKQ